MQQRVWLWYSTVYESCRRMENFMYTAFFLTFRAVVQVTRECVVCIENPRVARGQKIFIIGRIDLVFWGPVSLRDTGGGWHLLERPPLANHYCTMSYVHVCVCVLHKFLSFTPAPTLLGTSIALCKCRYCIIVRITMYLLGAFLMRCECA